MKHVFPLEAWMAGRPLRVALVMCVLLALFIFGSAMQ